MFHACALFTNLSYSSLNFLVSIGSTYFSWIVYAVKKSDSFHHLCQAMHFIDVYKKLQIASQQSLDCKFLCE